MPTSGDSIRTLEYQDTIDQIYEILQKYQSHLIVIGGDLNENLSTKSVNERKGYLLDFINLSIPSINQN
jgi:metallophosphoesterase superfamily enzyme